MRVDLQRVECLKLPVPPEGRNMTPAEARRLLNMGFAASKDMFLVGGGPTGGVVVYGAPIQQFELFPEGAGASVTGEVVCLSKPVPPEGRTLTQYEVLRARKEGISCSTSTYVKPYPGGGAVRWSAGGGFHYSGFVMVERPSGCYCGWCEVVGCKSRRGGGE